MDQITQLYSDLFWPLQGRRMWQGQIHNVHNGTKANHFFAVPPAHHTKLSKKSVLVLLVHTLFSVRRVWSIASQFIKTGLRNLSFLHIPHYDFWRKPCLTQEYSLEATAFICTCAVHVLHSVPWLVSPIIQLHPKNTEAGLFSPYVLSTYKMFLKILTRHMH